MIKYDAVSKRYYSIASRLHETINTNRNLLSLMASDDFENWYANHIDEINALKKAII